MAGETFEVTIRRFGRFITLTNYMDYESTDVMTSDWRLAPGGTPLGVDTEKLFEALDILKQAIK